MRPRLAISTTGVVATCLLGCVLATHVEAAPPPPRASRAGAQSGETRDEAIRIVAIVGFVDPDGPDGPKPCTVERRRRIRGASDRVITALSPIATLRRTFACSPILLAELAQRDEALLASLPDITAVDPDLPSRASLTESIPAIHAEIPRALGAAGHDVGIAVIDSGILTTHVDLAGALIEPGYHVLAQGTDVGEGGVEDDEGHGTHIASIIAGRGVHALGIAPMSRVLPIRVLDATGNGWMSDWAFAVDWLTANRDRFDVPMRIANLSIGTTGAYARCPCDAGLRTASAVFAAARDSGIVIVAASGNEAEIGRIEAPACLSSVIAVGAGWVETATSAPWGGSNCVDDAHPFALACFTDRNECLDVVAPGVRISAAGTETIDSIITLSGTSQAVPHVSGVLAQILSREPELAPEALELAIATSTTVRVLDPIDDGASYPWLDALGAHRRAACFAACEGDGVCNLPCDDDDPCTAGDGCTTGLCTGTSTVSCDDGNPCTTDAPCDRLAGCVHAFRDAPCDDGNPCTIGDRCSAGACVGAAIDCADAGADDVRANDVRAEDARPDAHLPDRAPPNVGTSERGVEACSCTALASVPRDPWGAIAMLALSLLRRRPRRRSPPVEEVSSVS